jgi:hypothetical protein
MYGTAIAFDETSGKKKRVAIPTADPPQAINKINFPAHGDSTNTAIGVYVAAIAINIKEWSS